ncbi:hypothetical protein [Streptomyces sp. NPDC046261]|uniref:hypothetical protein n=1 Tax=Streptomyces sp. NPDC046261 TaxID=3157200 RepID=UPI0034025D70
MVEALYPGDKESQAVTLRVLLNGESAQAARADIVAYGWWDTTWKYTKCVAAVGAAFIPTSKACKAIKELGGVAEAAKLLVVSRDIDAFKRAAGNAPLHIHSLPAARHCPRRRKSPYSITASTSA